MHQKKNFYSPLWHFKFLRLFLLPNTKDSFILLIDWNLMSLLLYGQKELLHFSKHRLLCSAEESQKCIFCHHLLVLVRFQTCLTFFLAWNKVVFNSILLFSPCNESWLWWVLKNSQNGQKHNKSILCSICFLNGALCEKPAKRLSTEFEICDGWVG